MLHSLFISTCKRPQMTHRYVGAFANMWLPSDVGCQRSQGSEGSQGSPESQGSPGNKTELWECTLGFHSLSTCTLAVLQLCVCVSVCLYFSDAGSLLEVTVSIFTSSPSLRRLCN